MAAFFLLLTLLGGALVGDLVWENTTAGDVTVLDRTVAGYPEGWLLAAAAAIGFVLLSGGGGSAPADELSRLAPPDALAWVDLAPHDDARELADALRRWNEQNAETLRLLARVMPRLLPATLALESLLALALAWSLYHRLNRARVGPPLARLRDFRFSDELVWGVVVGLVLALVPTLAPLRGAGYNLLAFFGALYALRGLGVLSWFFAPGRAAAAVLIVLGSVFLPVSLPLALGLGLGDTWLDLRSRARPTT
jgi:hypothetical protein